VLDFSVLQPGRAATETIAQIASDLKLASQYQVRVRQTGNTGTLRNFVTAVLVVEPNATGPAVGLFEAPSGCSKPAKPWRLLLLPTLVNFSEDRSGRPPRLAEGLGLGILCLIGCLGECVCGGL
jgi:hypothetical protein